MSEKARTAAFDLLVAMGRKMQQGGVVKRSLLTGDSMEVEGGAASEGSDSFNASFSVLIDTNFGIHGCEQLTPALKST